MGFKIVFTGGHSINYRQGGEILAENFYGETAIAEKYIRREWTRKFRIENIVGPNSNIDQNIIIAQKIH